jgi:hypothetical protein
MERLYAFRGEKDFEKRLEDEVTRKGKDSKLGRTDQDFIAHLTQPKNLVDQGRSFIKLDVDSQVGPGPETATFSNLSPVRIISGEDNDDRIRLG